MPGREVAFQPLEHPPPVDDGKLNVESDRVDFELVRERDAFGAGGRDEAFETVLVRHVDQESGKVLVVLDHDDDAVLRSDVRTVVGHLARGDDRLDGRAHCVDIRHDRNDLLGLRGRAGRLGRGVDVREVEREGAALAG